MTDEKQFTEDVLEGIIAIAEGARFYSNCALNEFKGLEMSSGRTRFEMYDPIYYTAYLMGTLEGRNHAYNTIYSLCLKIAKLSDKEMRVRMAERRLKLVNELPK
ncbi:hypothetical protein J4230_05115 [Candidatus Woesearchaeota archaeon]|nr:hypothetical protein [Candidatus Woesearchaeota archaeon]